MAYIEPCEVEELLGSCCNCEVTPGGENNGAGAGGNNGGGAGGNNGNSNLDEPDCGWEAWCYPDGCDKDNIELFCSQHPNCNECDWLDAEYGYLFDDICCIENSDGVSSCFALSGWGLPDYPPWWDVGLEQWCDEEGGLMQYDRCVGNFPSSSWGCGSCGGAVCDDGDCPCYRCGEWDPETRTCDCSASDCGTLSQCRCDGCCSPRGACCYEGGTQPQWGCEDDVLRTDCREDLGAIFYEGLWCSELPEDSPCWEEEEDCGGDWGAVCQEDIQCADHLCCRDIGANSSMAVPGRDGYWGSVPPQDAFRCWDCDGIDMRDSEGNYNNCDGCEPGITCQGNCPHGYACYWDGITNQHSCIPWAMFCILCDHNDPIGTCSGCSSPSWPDYYDCGPSTNLPCSYQTWPGFHLEDTTPGACCQHEYAGEGEFIYIGCEITSWRNCLLAEGRGKWWGPNTTCGEFEDCCDGEPEPEPDECVVNADCGEGLCCSDSGECVTCDECDCECFDSISEWECCEQTEGNGIWNAGQTCEDIECECPEEPECGPDSPCPLPCYNCEDGICVPECDENSDCSPNSCCVFNCCTECEPECTDDLQCSGEQCCVNNSCTYNCSQTPCVFDSECPGEQECEDGVCIDPEPDEECEENDDCPYAKCCEEGECIFCDPEPPDEGDCVVNADCGEGLCCWDFEGFKTCFACEEEEECECLGGGAGDCQWQLGGSIPCGPDDIPDEDGLCYGVYCCCDDPACQQMACY